MTMGRPTKLTPELIADAELFLSEHDVSVHTLLPTIEGLALRLNISRDTLYQWAKNDKDFSDILEKLRQMQANKLLQNGVIGKYNPVISKLMLSKHGYVDKTETDLTSGGDKLQTALVEFVSAKDKDQSS